MCNYLSQTLKICNIMHLLINKMKTFEITYTVFNHNCFGLIINAFMHFAILYRLNIAYILEFYSCMKFRVSCIRVLAAIIVVCVFSCIIKVFYFFVYVFSCTNKVFIVSCMYFRVSIYIFIFYCIFRVFFVY